MGEQVIGPCVVESLLTAARLTLLIRTTINTQGHTFEEASSDLAQKMDVAKKMCTVQDFLERSNSAQKATAQIFTGFHPVGRTGLEPVTDGL